MAGVKIGEAYLFQNFCNKIFHIEETKQIIIFLQNWNKKLRKVKDKNGQMLMFKKEDVSVFTPI